MGDTRIVAFADSQAGGEDSDEERRKRRKKRRAVKSKKYVLRIINNYSMSARWI